MSPMPIIPLIGRSGILRYVLLLMEMLRLFGVLPFKATRKPFCIDTMNGSSMLAPCSAAI